ncbi:tyrosine-protein phosphatase [Curtobacterium sp. ISL-83]|uniref:tyrosine-protein phosphatase n=1 Tax=Curtobacterium sp. ISL-83 TaxID=2819145 RepID=UPI001BEABAEE|nr:tyrosine-protein phosphatase [Curtobacterium sp. ISL-83]MBT2502339.1 tyrosine-protein phosphatase [Curtobacterium sp. ISL-83]
MSDARTLHAEGLFNGRDLGRLPRLTGGSTPTGRVFRSENLDRLTPAGWQELHDLGIRTVVDLRAPSELEKDTGHRPDWLTTVVVDHDGLDAAPAFWEAYWETGLVGTPLYYGPHLEQLPERTSDALRAIARAEPGGVLFHCAGGRDRTGIVALALLTIAGVDPEAIVDDYLETVDNAPALLASIGVPANEDKIEALCAAYGTTVADAFRAAVDAFDIDEFVARSGLDASDLEALRTFRARVA